MYYVLRIIDLLRQRILFKRFGVKVGDHCRVNGVPILKGEHDRLTIGDNFFGNSNKNANPIGYSVPLSFWTLGGGKINIGKNVGISNAALVAYGANIEIEDDVMIGGGAKIYTSDFHSLDYKHRMQRPDEGVKHKDVTIRKGAFVGSGAIILKGVTVGEYAVVGAGSVVTRDIPANEIWAGNPAKFIRTL